MKILNRLFPNKKAPQEASIKIQNIISNEFKNTFSSVELAIEELKWLSEDLKQNNSPDNSSNLNNITARIESDIIKLKKSVSDLENSYAGMENVTLEEIDFKSFLYKIVDGYQNYHSKGARIYELNYCADALKATIDADKFTKILNQLLNNSTKHTAQGIIIVQVLENKDEWCVVVKDSGDGINSQRLYEIFEKLSGNGVEDVEEKKGLGLIIVKKLVDLHLGRIQISSMPGKRTLITINFPKNLPIGNFNVPVNKYGKSFPEVVYFMKK